MKFLFCGLGSIGRRHLSILKNKGGHIFSAYRSGKGQKKNIEPDVEIIPELEKNFLKDTDAAFITNPTCLHIQTALELTEYGIPMFIEKPLDKSLEGAGKLLSIVEKEKIPVLMGYNMLHHPAIKTLDRLLKEEIIGKPVSAKAQFGTFMPGWHPEEDYRKSYAAVKSMGGGAVLTSIHEQNYLTKFFGNVTKTMAMETGGNITGIGCEEGVEILLKHTGGVVSNIHLNFYQKPYYRNCQIMGTEGTLYWDYSIPEIKILYSDRTEIIKLGDNTGQLLERSYSDQMDHFIEVINREKEPVAGLKEGIEDLKTALEILHQINRN